MADNSTDTHDIFNALSKRKRALVEPRNPKIISTVEPTNDENSKIGHSKVSHLANPVETDQFESNQPTALPVAASEPQAVDQIVEFRQLESSQSEISQTVISPTIAPIEQKTTAEPDAPVEDLSVERRTLRIETEIDEGLDAFCKRNRITRDVFIEAAFLACQDNPAFLNTVLPIAQANYRKRKMIGERRKFDSMQKKFQD